MGYKQKSFPMHQGTSSHTSALKQSEIDVDKIIDKEQEKKNVKAVTLDPIDVSGDLTSKVEKPTKAEVPKKVKKRSKKSLDKIEKDAIKAYRKEELDEAKDKGKTARKQEKHDAKIKKAGESIATKKARRKAKWEKFQKDIDPIFQAMNEPISADARGYFPQETETEDKGRAYYESMYHKDKNKILEERIKNMKKESSTNGTDNVTKHIKPVTSVIDKDSILYHDFSKGLYTPKKDK